jgi:hypothetical protein
MGLSQADKAERLNNLALSALEREIDLDLFHGSNSSTLM